MREGDVFFLGLDQNQDEGSLHNCYGSPFISKFSMEMLRRIKAELPVSPTFNPESFDYVRMWNPRNGLYFHGFNSKGNNEFALGNEKIRTPQNGKVSYVNAWKLKQEFLERAYRESGFRTIDRLDGPGNRIHIHALEAV